MRVSLWADERIRIVEILNTASAFETQQVRHNWGWFLALGVLLVVLGVLCLSSTVLATLLTTGLLGALAIIGGVELIVSAFWGENGWGIALRIVIGILFVLAGWSLLTRPVIGALTLTAIIGWFFLFSGMLDVIIALMEHVRGWGWGVINGLVTLLLGVLLLASWPASGLIAIGLFLGIRLLLSGILWISASIGARAALPPQSAMG